jgi:hypothetical protein
VTEKKEVKFPGLTENPMSLILSLLLREFLLREHLSFTALHGSAKLLVMGVAVGVPPFGWRTRARCV